MHDKQLPLLIEARKLTLEAFALDPGSHLLTLWEWMLGTDAVYDDGTTDEADKAPKGMVDGRGGKEGRALKPWVASLVQAAEKAVRRDPNAKYRGSYCSAVGACVRSFVRSFVHSFGRGKPPFSGNEERE